MLQFILWGLVIAIGVLWFARRSSNKKTRKTT